MPKPISSRKLAANRRNALHATGPRSPEGKEKVSTDESVLRRVRDALGANNVAKDDE